MNNFFDFLLALLTFDWLRQRGEAEAHNQRVDEWMIMSMPQGECVDCEDTVYYDAPAGQWKHLGNHQIMSKTPHGAPHRAVKWLGWERIIAAEKKMGIYDPANDPTLPEAPVTSVGKGPRPIA